MLYKTLSLSLWCRHTTLGFARASLECSNAGDSILKKTKSLHYPPLVEIKSKDIMLFSPIVEFRRERPVKSLWKVAVFCFFPSSSKSRSSSRTQRLKNKKYVQTKRDRWRTIQVDGVELKGVTLSRYKSHPTLPKDNGWWCTVTRTGVETHTIVTHTVATTKLVWPNWRVFQNCLR